MRRRGWVSAGVAALLLVSVGGCSSVPVPPPVPPPPRLVLHQDGFDGLRMGREMADVSVSDLEGALGAEGEFELLPETDECGTATHVELGLTAITDSDLALHAIVADGEVETPEGIGVGSAVDEIREAYGEAVLTENATATETHVFVGDLDRPGEVTSESMLYAFVVDASGEVRSLRAGRMPWLLGCAATESGADEIDGDAGVGGTGTGPGDAGSQGTGSEGTGSEGAGWEETGPGEAGSERAGSGGAGLDGAVPGLSAGFSGVGEVPLGGTVAGAGEALGVTFGPVTALNGDGSCGLAEAASDGLAVVVATPGGVQAVVVARPDIPFVEATHQPVGVGSTVAEVRAAFPRWVGSDDKVSLAGGERITVAPQERAGRALLMEADEAGIIRQYRVGVAGYVLHEDYCTTSD